MFIKPIVQKAYDVIKTSQAQPMPTGSKSVSRPPQSDITTHISNISSGRVGVPSNYSVIEDLTTLRKLG